MKTRLNYAILNNGEVKEVIDSSVVLDDDSHHTKIAWINSLVESNPGCIFFLVTDTTDIFEAEDEPEIESVSMMFDANSPNWGPDPKYALSFLKATQNHMNNVLQIRGWLVLNDVLDAVGLERTAQGMTVGWRRDADEDGTGDGFIDFGLDSEDEYTLAFIRGEESTVLLDFNVDGDISSKVS